MSGWVVALGVYAAYLVAMVTWERVGHRRARRAYDAKVRLTLSGLVALLPGELRRLTFTEYAVKHTHTPGELSVLLLYELPRGLVYRGPRGQPHVGLVFDAGTGGLLRVEPNGAGADLERRGAD